MSTSDRPREEAPPARAAEHCPAGEYGEGAPHKATGVGPRNPRTSEQRLNDQPGHSDSYGNVAPGRYGVDGYSGSPGQPQAPARDDQLRELIRQRLTEDPSLDASDVTVEVHDGRAILAGTVASGRLKAEIEQTVENCGAAEVDNQLRALS